jgi:tRNA G18 (ribose-2'-O)-methylase SpoU
VNESPAANVQTVESLDDPRLWPYRNLKDRELAREGGLFIAEGRHGVERLLASDFPVQSVLVAHKRLEGMRASLPVDAPTYVVPDDAVERIVGFKFHSGVIACGRRKAVPTLEALMRGAGEREGVADTKPITLVVCPQVLNHDNLGALVRISTCFGADAMLLGERSCDPFWRRSIRVSMGSVFTLPIRTSADLAADLLRLHDAWCIQRIATVTDADAEPLARAARPQRLALLFGSESQGLGEPWLSLCDRRVTIPMHLGTDSLNVAVAAAVFLFRFTG